jgi:hypothetical protein
MLLCMDVLDLGGGKEIQGLCSYLAIYPMLLQTKSFYFSLKQLVFTTKELEMVVGTGMAILAKNT